MKILNAMFQTLPTGQRAYFPLGGLVAGRIVTEHEEMRLRTFIARTWRLYAASIFLLTVAFLGALFAGLKGFGPVASERAFILFMPLFTAFAAAVFAAYFTTLIAAGAPMPRAEAKFSRRLARAEMRSAVGDAAQLAIAIGALALLGFLALMLWRHHPWLALICLAAGVINVAAAVLEVARGMREEKS